MTRWIGRHVTGIRIVVALAVVVLRARGSSAQTPEVELRPGMVITRSVHVRPGAYRLGASASPDSALITIRGSGITVDFRGATLIGIREDAPPDSARGVAILIDGGRNVTLENARVRGYKVAVLARRTRNLRLLHNDLGYNWKPRLYSLIEHESLADWLTYHKNEKDEWLRYGAAVYLADVDRGEVRGNRAEQGMNGLMMVRTTGVRVWNNTFSYLSGVGIGLYRSSDNVIMHNRADYCVRGYSHGFYRRGQDSAGLLMYEQSSRNVVAYNSMTHGGDGLFLWAGQSTMDTGAGGANDNLFFGNDFSHAPANGMEATFSRNTFVANRVEENDHGLWGGYSYGSVVLGNQFVRNVNGISIEHGQDNVITSNTFTGDSTAVNLWWKPIEPSEWGYPKHRDTRSRDYIIRDNIITGARVGVRAASTSHLTMQGNHFASVDSVAVLTGDTAGDRVADNHVIRSRVLPDTTARAAAARRARAVARYAPTPITGAMHAMLRSDARRGRATIIVDEWGPYDYRSPKLWPIGSPAALPVRLRVLGPPGRWRLVDAGGVTAISDSAGTLSDTITITPRAGAITDWRVRLEYLGGGVRSPRGVTTRAGRPYTFEYSRFDVATDWDARFFAWSDSTDPRTHADAFATLLASAPRVAQRTPRLDYIWGKPKIENLPQDRIALLATTTLELPGGGYLLRTISDDGVRVWIDGVLVIDHWTPHESEVDEAPFSGGRHTMRVEYYQVDGWTELRVEVAKRPSSRQ